MFGTFFKAAACAALVCSAVPAAAATTYDFNTTTSGTYSSAGSGAGNSYTFTSAVSGEHVVATGFQSSQAAGNAVASQTVGLYSPGLGVTGAGDYSGAYAYHQVDNVNGYTDFVLLTFDHAVTLTNIGLNSFNMGDSSDNIPAYLSTRDNDLAFLALTSPFSSASVTTSGWTTVNGSGTDGAIATGSGAASRQWLVGAAFNSSNNDGFKIASLRATSAVPEPATWAMMLIGFGAAGVSLRRRRPVLAMQAA